MIPIQIKILRQNKVVSYFYILEAGRGGRIQNVLTIVFCHWVNEQNISILCATYIKEEL